MNQKRLDGGASYANLFPSPHPLVAHKLSKLRQQDVAPKKFRELTRELSALLTYKATQDLVTTSIRVQTPLKETEGLELAEKVGLIPILRSGLEMVEGVWELMPSAEV